MLENVFNRYIMVDFHFWFGCLFFCLITPRLFYNMLYQLWIQDVCLVSDHGSYPSMILVASYYKCLRCRIVISSFHLWGKSYLLLGSMIFSWVDVGFYQVFTVNGNIDAFLLLIVCNIDFNCNHSCHPGINLMQLWWVFSSHGSVC